MSERIDLAQALKRNWTALVPYIVFIALTAIMVSVQPGTLGFGYMATKMDAAITLVLVTAGQTIVLVSGGFDLSVGGVVCVTNSLVAVNMQDSPESILGWALISLLIGAGIGFFNGFVVARTRMQPFIVTLVTLSVCQGWALLILRVDGGSVPGAVASFFMHRVGGILPVSFFAIVLLIAWWLFFKRTPTGLALYMVGCNPNAARLNGISLTKMYILAYTVSGLFAAFAGIYRTALVASGSPTAGTAFTMLSICAAVIGGTAISGGAGGIVGGVFGALIMRGITEILVFLHVSSYLTLLVQGLLLILAVTITSYAQLRKKKRGGRQ